MILAMDKVRIIRRKGPSEALKRVGLAIEQEYGIEPLRDGESRPDGYYLVNRYTTPGRRPVRVVAGANSKQP
jgi:hypothetical protein